MSIWLTNFTQIMTSFDWRPLVLTLATATLVMSFSYYLAVALARFVSGKSQRTKAIWDGVLLIPMLLPPTAMGFLLLVLFGIRQPLGFLLYENLHVQFERAYPGCFLAAFVVSFPIMYRCTRAALERVDQATINAARTLGVREADIFNQIVLPQAEAGINSGMVLTMGRALGEYGATALLAGTLAGEEAETDYTVAQVIVRMIRTGDVAAAWIWVLVMMVIAAVLVMLMNRFGNGRRK